MSNFDINYFIQLATSRIKREGIDNFDFQSFLDGCVYSDTLEFLSSIDKRKIKQIVNDNIERESAKKALTIIPVSVVSRKSNRLEWYSEWKASNPRFNDRYYWNKLEDYLNINLTAKMGAKKAGIIIQSINHQTDALMPLLINPENPKFKGKGLVVGYVQSGKTANFTALIAKAVDAGYRMIVVLAGMHNILRKQTQVRLDQEITGEKDFESAKMYTSFPPIHLEWNRLTTGNNDFINKNIKTLDRYSGYSNPILAVVKKNVSILKKLHDYFHISKKSTRANLPLLIIDDEADQATIDGNYNTDNDPTKTNRLIKQIISLFPRNTYVGYTATPFANILIDVSTEDSLYPKDFIYSLPLPEGYFGADIMFRNQLSENFINFIPSDEAEAILSKFEITHHLSVAIDQYLIASAVRNIRGDRLKPSSMLIHLSYKKDDMSTVFEVVDKYIFELKQRFFHLIDKESLVDDFKVTYDSYLKHSEVINKRMRLKNHLPNLNKVLNEIPKVLEKVDVLLLNSDSTDELDYTKNEEIKVIAIGGNKLSRGLTLEGLVVSYYLRNSKQYDTLLQMGRWFGYREGYEDLTRVHTTERIADFFQDLAAVESELRSDISRYEDPNITPKDFALAIRAHKNLKVTARNKMGAARSRKESYSKSLNQTFWIQLDMPDILDHNYNLVEGFINLISGQGNFVEIKNSGFYHFNTFLNGRLVLKKFLEKFKFASPDDTGGPGLDSVAFLDYIRRCLYDHSELKEWSLTIAGKKKESDYSKRIALSAIDIIPVERSRKITERGYNLGVISDHKHLNADLNFNKKKVRSPNHPHLVIYIISKHSRAKKSDNGIRLDLFHELKKPEKDVIGLAVILPESKKEPNSYIGQLV